jgi:hypothetical protein
MATSSTTSVSGPPTSFDSTAFMFRRSLPCCFFYQTVAVWQA